MSNYNGFNRTRAVLLSNGSRMNQSEWAELQEDGIDIPLASGWRKEDLNDWEQIVSDDDDFI